MNKQREVVYHRRREILTADTLRDDVLEMANEQAAMVVASQAGDELPPFDFLATGSGSST